MPGGSRAPSLQTRRLLLLSKLTAEITAHGPLPLSRYMELCNTHYYATRDPLGLSETAGGTTGGDFTTAPEISQLFGELLGLWAVAEWERLGRPVPFILAELGPGRGTLMHDALRAARIRPQFLEALQLQLVETSPTLQILQEDKLQDYQPQFHDSIDTLPALPLLLIANEFFDALPVTQLVHTKSGWLQKHVTLQDGALAFCDLPVAAASIPADLQTVPLDTIIEHSPATRAIMQQLCTHLAAHGGSAAIIDYSACVTPALLQQGDTLQAMQNHAHADPLQTPGEADLTCHVDFAPLLALAKAAQLHTSFGTQSDFLQMLGIGPRVAQLCLAHPEQTETLNLAHARLTDRDQMGTLFKVLAVSSR